ncbi:SDR family NAD(P)-dependent oxidoreductase [Rhizobium rhizogenes]|uniref:SDR family NAD(P)-dependent oxidoreductase n=1 Tax=Rhizobium rhizogenes TaxID=359 RepID=UPI0015739788|nr:SDR family oxidoreductase [Rhizobium rhizogenes]NTF59621.1 SDR family oxidoreductase [Rhizobium rhizogenes]NTF79181.1 SDR family oxidoreductase [Rhizobium rhizogenes]NTF96022.1 SDR family oxidoreductase [Rhizobium rhizogenes]NTH53741.1 SDR family oxidoreductase [Rhizobium rhizogenes]NTH73325.1 SDR family oxidoreductase [Rhizobium rhizogenes]
MTLAGKLAVVTGGASGIGAACCRELVRHGARIVVLDRAEEAARAVAAELNGVAKALDVGSPEHIEAVAKEIEAEFGIPDIVVNSAGIIQLPLPPEDLSLELWDDVIRINQRGTYLTCLAFGRRMATARKGSIVNIASIAGMRSMPLHAYSPAKAAVIAMTENLAAEWGRSQVRVNAVSPGYTLTPAIKGAIDRGERDPSKLSENSALGRMVKPDEIAAVVAFLAGPAASAVTGANIPVDCGATVAMSWNPYGGVGRKPPNDR